MIDHEIDELVLDDYRPTKLPERAFIGEDGEAIALIHRITIKNSPNLVFFSGNTTSNSTFFDGLNQILEQVRVEQCNNIDRNEWNRVSVSLGGPRSMLQRLLLNSDNVAFRQFNFHHLHNLERILLRNNKLRVIDTDLSPYTNLQLLDLSNNEIDTFLVTGYAPRLTTLYLVNNRIQYIDERIFSTLVSVRIIDLRGERYKYDVDSLLICYFVTRK